MKNIALVGVGGAGMTHLQNIRQMKDVRVSALCDPSSSAYNVAKEFGADCFDDLADMLRVAPIDIVMICTPTFLHGEQVRQTLSSGKHCFCEKPLCLSSQEARALYALSREKGVLLFVGQVLRFFEAYELAADAVCSGRYGKLIDAHLYRLTAKPAWQKGNWIFECDKSGLIPFDLHIHDLDFLTSILGKPEIKGVQRGGGSVGDPENDYYRVQYAFGGVSANIEASWYQVPSLFMQGYRLYFEKALLLYDGTCAVVYEKGCEMQILLDERVVGRTTTCINVAPTNAFCREITHFLHCVREGKKETCVHEDQVVSVLETLEMLACQ